MHTINTIIFDLDGTLRHSEPNGNELFWDFVAAQGAPGELNHRREALIWAHNYWANSETLLEDQQQFEPDSPEFWANYAYRHLLALGTSNGLAGKLAPQVHAYMRANYNPVDSVPADVIPTLKQLKEADYIIGLVTNRRKPIDELLPGWGFGDYLDFHFAAGEIGSWKPDPEIFHYALGLAGVSPQQAVYVGDNYFADIQGAEAAQVKPVLVDPLGIWEGYAQCAIIHAIGELPEVLLNGRVEQAISG
jgi:HAD superfamily hydrolase (TIGR01549 family)